MKKLLFTIGLCLTAMVCSVSWGYAKQQAWKIGHVRPAGSAIDIDISRFTEAITDKTGGAIDFTIYPANKLGDYSVVQERVSFGEVEMYVGPFGTAVDKRLMLAFTPFLVDTWSGAQRLYSASSPLFKYLQSFLEPQNIKLIGGWPVYFGGIALTEKPVEPGNPDVSKDMIIRVPPIRSFELTAKALGYTPYPITWMYAKMGLKTGMVKGMIGGGAEGYKGLSNLISFYLPLKDHFEYWFVYMNLETWNSLSDEQQKIITDQAQQMESRRYSIAEQDERQNLAALKELGVDVQEISDSEYQRMRSKIRQSVWPQLRKDIGQSFDEVIQFVEQGK
jgi:TRAP-type C4-dicarboxylate transport system substrate-binding protein